MAGSLQYQLYRAEADDGVAEAGLGEQEGLVVVFKRAKGSERYEEELDRLLRGCSRVGLQGFAWADFAGQLTRSDGESRLLGPPAGVTDVIPDHELMRLMGDCASDIALASSAERNLIVTVALMHGMLTMLVLTFFQHMAHLALWLFFDPIILWVVFVFLLEIYNSKKYKKPFRLSLGGPARRYRNRIEERLRNANEMYSKLLFEHHWNWIQLSLGHMEAVSVRVRESIAGGQTSDDDGNYGASADQEMLDQV